MKRTQKGRKTGGWGTMPITVAQTRTSTCQTSPATSCQRCFAGVVPPPLALIRRQGWSKTLHYGRASTGSVLSGSRPPLLLLSCEVVVRLLWSSLRSGAIQTTDGMRILIGEIMTTHVYISHSDLDFLKFSIIYILKIFF